MLKSFTASGCFSTDSLGFGERFSGWSHVHVEVCINVSVIVAPTGCQPSLESFAFRSCASTFAREGHDIA